MEGHGIPVRLFFAAAVISVPFLYGHVAGTLLAAWETDDYSYGFLIPPVACCWGVAILQRQAVLPRPSAFGTSVLAIGVMLDLLGVVLANNWLSAVSLLPALAGLIVLVLGMAALRAVAVPLSLLLFAIPLPATVYPALTAKMQLLSSDLGVWGIQTLGLSAFEEGNVIDLGGTRLQVAEACSGLRYVFPLMFLGYLAAFVFLRMPWKRISLVAMTLPIAIGMNALRIVFVGVTVARWGAGMAEERLHALEGFVVFAGCVGCLWLMVAVLSRIGPRENPEIPAFAPRWGSPLWRGLAVMPARIALPSALVLLCGAAAVTFLDAPGGAAPPQRLCFDRFPMHIASWQGERESLTPQELRSLNLTDYLSATYRRQGRAEPVTLYIAYYASQRQGSAIHSPTICIPAAGWEIVSLDRTTLALGQPGMKTLSVNRAVIRKGETKQLVVYWLRDRGRDVTSMFEIKWMMLRDYMRSGIRNGRTDGSLIRVSIPIATGQSEQQYSGPRISDHSVSYP